MRKWFSEIGKSFCKIRESQPTYWFLLVLSIGLVSGIGGGAIAVFVLRTTPLPHSDKYDVFVALLLIFFTLLGILGYGMYIWIRGKLESRLNERLQKEEQEIENSRNLFRARIQRNMGYIFWKLFEVEKKKEECKNTSVLKDLIKLAIERTEQSLKYAIELPENEYKEDINQCKANWVYFLAEAARIEGTEITKQDKEQALIVAKEILAEVSKQDYQENYYHYQESCAWALQHLSEPGDKISKQKASDIIRKLLNDGNTTYAWQEKQKEKWAHFLQEERDISTSIKNT